MAAATLRDEAGNFYAVFAGGLSSQKYVDMPFDLRIESLYQDRKIDRRT